MWKEFCFLSILDIISADTVYFFFLSMNIFIFRIGFFSLLSILYFFSSVSALSVSLQDAKTYHPNQGEQTITPLTITFDRDNETSSGSYLTLSLPTEANIRFSSKNIHSVTISGTGSDKIAASGSVLPDLLHIRFPLTSVLMK